MVYTLSWRNIPTAKTLFVMVFMAGIGLIVSIVALLYLSLHLISTKTNEIDEHRSALSVQGAIQTSVNRVSSLVIDNAVWDDAVREVYRPTLDTEWLYNTWGAGFKINNLYDGTFVLDENFNVLWGAFQSKPVLETNLDFFGNGLKALIERNKRALIGDKNIYAGITRTQYGVAFVGIGLIRPMMGRLQVHDGTRRYLVITRHLNPKILSDLGTTFQIDNLNYTAEKISAMGMPLRSSAGELLGYLNWQARLPGAQAARAASSDITQIVVLAAALILLFILVSSVGLYKLARGESQARRVARTDWLSHLPNRRALIEALEQVSLRGDIDLKSVVFIDLDGFKDVNDIYGHSVGDDLIIVMAKMLSERVPPGGMLARMGGDEFAMTIGGERAEALADAFAGSVLDFLKSPIRLGERTIHISASIGIASGTLIECTSNELFRRADIAMYHSKITGKGRITHYDAELNSVRERQLAIENQIRHGLERDEFEVWYQPIIDARSQKMTSVEALVRWPRRPEGELGPDSFISIAETSGLIYKLGQFVLHRACQDLEPFGDLKLSVNISPAQFRDPEFEDRVAKVLEITRFPANRLQLEVTETYVLENPERARTAIANLKALGTAVALDDFGTGYSSIGYLRRFNFDTIKIDKSLAGLVDNDEQAAALVSGTVRIANALGMAVVAEGVENEKQMKLLRLAGCDQLQGFWFSQPMPIESIIALRQVRQC
ncbi:bifunctional diguanylate cyclase/phosphodiesterase [Enterobacter huaxiensis]|uniref:Bifunctional diguanylate cyclase/phosphodiesterase n=1 Tax=Enterobacter huaxiensis TaxID=2494702 RepID=A0ABU6EKR5_9ENTR|nr:bifunctional diguanylate cyclase/phosphodiesterase [Enterobacter huaxiensis]MEB7541564.1 bifunctional diguanylate cyclase/phosphodiesterase [Enterobacter huaxiensis]MEB7580459.1 bifunctional diguanylate cyclase/phosphodiesterase [Enterobacter huaxiensis]MEB7661343.1 bifunctional diguanylate cyclase/phosphodiesterase [Enterobacter huaxiensis]